MNDKLYDAAWQLADEHRDGKLKFKSADWDKQRAEMLAELERRCPGFSAAEYEDALAQGYKDSR